LTNLLQHDSNFFLAYFILLLLTSAQVTEQP